MLGLLFAVELKSLATKGARAGSGSDAWGKFVEYFAESPDELTRLKVPGQEVNGIAAGTTTFTTITTTTTAACTFTFTTTTTTDI